MVPKNCIVVVAVLVIVQSVNCENTDKLEKFVSCDPVKASAEKSNECPLNSNCVELGAKNTTLQVNGLCACKSNYTVNKSYSSSDNNSSYCIARIDPLPQTTATPIPSTSSNPITTSTTVATIVSTNKNNNNSTLTTTSAPPLSSSSTTTASNDTKVVTELPATVKPSSNESSNQNKSNTHEDNKNNNNASPQKQQPEAHHFLGGIMLPLMFVLAFVGAIFAVRKYDLIERARSAIRNRRGAGQSHQTRYDGLENDFDDDPLLI